MNSAVGSVVSKLLGLMFLASLITSLACSKGAPTPTSKPTPTLAPEPTAGPGPSGIAPLAPDDSAGLLSRLSPDERDCITEFDLLADFWSKHPDVDYEDVAQQMGCLRDETLLSLYLAGLAWHLQDLGGVFRADTASCIRGSLDGTSLGGIVREAHTAERDLVRQAHTAVWDLTVWYCLSEEEVALAGPDSGITSDEYDGMICTVEAFGGLAGLAQMYKTTGIEEFTDALLTNASGCP